jgi:hypothetical protein
MALDQRNLRWRQLANEDGQKVTGCTASRWQMSTSPISAGFIDFVSSRSGRIRKFLRQSSVHRRGTASLAGRGCTPAHWDGASLPAWFTARASVRHASPAASLCRISSTWSVWALRRGRTARSPALSFPALQPSRRESDPLTNVQHPYIVISGRTDSMDARKSFGRRGKEQRIEARQIQKQEPQRAQKAPPLPRSSQGTALSSVRAFISASHWRTVALCLDM